MRTYRNTLNRWQWFFSFVTVIIASIAFFLMTESWQSNQHIRDSFNGNQRMVTDYVHLACQQKAMCESLASAYEECATANNIDTCVNIKTINGLKKLQSIQGPYSCQYGTPDAEFPVTKINCVFNKIWSSLEHDED